MCEFFSLILDAKRQWKIVFKALRGKYCQPTILHPVKVSIKCKVEKKRKNRTREKTWSDKQRLFTPFHRKFSEDLFQQIEVAKQESGRHGRHGNQEIVDPNQKGNNVCLTGSCGVDLLNDQFRSEQEDRGPQ